MSLTTTHTPPQQRLAETPPMGWNSFDSYGVYLHEEAALRNVDALAQKLLPHGYDTFVIDAGWYGEYRLQPNTRFSVEKHAGDIRLNRYGLVQPSLTYFPRGFGAIAKRCRDHGIKLGIHIMRGVPRKAVHLRLPIEGTSHTAADIAKTDDTCSWCHYNYGINTDHPAGPVYYQNLVNQLAQWGVDFIKADDIVPFPDEIEALAQAINQSDREMVLSLSPGGNVLPDALEQYQYGHMLRVTPDIWDEQADIDTCFQAWRKWARRGKPGFWIDMDMIPFGQLQIMTPKQAGIDHSDSLLAGKGYHRWCRLNPDQKETFITLRALAQSPLMVGGDLPSMDKHSLGLLTHPEMVACNQRSAGAQLILDVDNWEIWKADSQTAEHKSWLAVFNRAGQKRTNIFQETQLGISSRSRVSDIWKPWNNLQRTRGKLKLNIPAHGCRFFSIER